MEVPAWVYEQAGEDVEIQPYEGPGPHGDLYGAAVTVRVVVDDTARLVRTGTGDQVLASSTLTCPLSTVAPVKSLITVRGRTTTVLASSRLDGGALPVPSHVEVALA